MDTFSSQLLTIVLLVWIAILVILNMIWISCCCIRRRKVQRSKKELGDQVICQTRGSPQSKLNCLGNDFFLGVQWKPYSKLVHIDDEASPCQFVQKLATQYPSA